MKRAQHVHNFIRARSTVIHVAQYVKQVDCQLLYQVAHCYYEVHSTPCRYDCSHHHIYVGLLIRVACALMEQFLYDVREILWQCLIHLRARIFRRHVAANLHEPVYRNKVPVVPLALVLQLLTHELKLVFRIINQSTQFLLVASTQSLIKNLFDLSLYRSRSIAQHMLKSVILSV